MSDDLKQRGWPEGGAAGASYRSYDRSTSLTQILTQLEVPTDRPVLIIVGYADDGYGPHADRVSLLLRTVVASA